MWLLFTVVVPSQHSDSAHLYLMPCHVFILLLYHCFMWLIQYENVLTFYSSALCFPPPSFFLTVCYTSIQQSATYCHLSLIASLCLTFCSCVLHTMPHFLISLCLSELIFPPSHFLCVKMFTLFLFTGIWPAQQRFSGMKHVNRMACHLRLIWHIWKKYVNI